MTKTRTQQQDAHGRLMYDHYKGKEVYEIIQRDDGFIQAIPVSTYFTSYHQWPKIEKDAMKYVKGRVLDIGCGAGRHSLRLQRRGFNVLGIDVSPLAIKVAKLRGLKNAKTISFEDASLKLGVFDTVVMLGNNFGLFRSFTRARLLLRKLHNMTSQHAVIIAETRDPYKTSDPDHLAYHLRNKRLGRMPGQVKMRILYRKLRTPWFDYLLASKEEIKRIVKGSGWKVRRFIGQEVQCIAIIEKSRQ